MKTGLHGRDLCGHLGGKPAAVTLKRSGGYPWPPTDTKPERSLVGASTLSKLADPFEGGADWGIGLAAKAAGSRRTELGALKRAEDVVAAVKAAGLAASVESRDKGSEVHSITAHLDCGVEPPEYDTDDLGPYVAAWQAFCTDWGIIHGAVERTLFAPEVGVAGTTDRISRATTAPDTAQLSPNDVIVLDIKTKYGKTLDRVDAQLGHAVQLTALSMATHIYYEEWGDLQAMPTVNAAAAVYLCKDGYRVYLLPIHEEGFLQVVAKVADAANSVREIRSAALGRPISCHLIVPEIPPVTVLQAS